MEERFIPIADYVKSHESAPAAMVDLLLHQVLGEMAQWRIDNPDVKGCVRLENIYIDENNPFSIKISGFDENCVDDVKSYGEVLSTLLGMLKVTHKRARKIANACCKGEFNNLGDVMLAVEKRDSNVIYIVLIAIIVIMILILAWLNN